MAAYPHRSSQATSTRYSRRMCSLRRMHLAADVESKADDHCVIGFFYATSNNAAIQNYWHDA